MATVKVGILEARDLPVMDRSTGLADPYVVVKVDDMQETTPTCAKTRNPVWHSEFRFDTPDLLTLQEDPVELRVYDYDMFSRDDLIGFVFIDLNSIIEQATPNLKDWFPIFDTMHGLRGELLVDLKVKFHAAQNPFLPVTPLRSVKITDTVRMHSTTAAATSDEASNAVVDPLSSSTNTREVSFAPEIESPFSGGGGMQQSEWPPVALATSAESRLTPVNGGSMSRTNSMLVGKLDGNAEGRNAARRIPVVIRDLDVETTESALDATSGRARHTSLTTEVEGVFIFAMSRLDPSVFRVESVFGMAEELLVKPDPEQSSLASLRSSRVTYEARLLQLYKLSGKVRRQLSKKVIELGCNCVLGYTESFDFEAHGIVVRACGTPCVVSTVGYEHQEVVAPVVMSAAASMITSHPSTIITSQQSSLMAPPTNGSMTDGSLPRPLSLNAGSLTAHPTISPKVGAASTPNVLGTPLSGPVTLPDAQESGLWQPPSVHLIGNDNPTIAIEGDPQFRDVPTRRDIGVGTQDVAEQEDKKLRDVTKLTRSQVLVLTVDDLPAGTIQNIGGAVCARSVKLVTKLKSKAAIATERDSWWMELREEIKGNARSFHCNAIMCYREEALFINDVALLTITGTAVLVDDSWSMLRAGPDALYSRMYQRFMQQRQCSILHLHTHSHSHGHHGHHHYHHHSRAADEFVCGVCKRKPVPEVLISTAALPSEVTVEGQPRLVEVRVLKAKPDSRGVDLALHISQQLPSIEYSLNRQLLFRLKLYGLNAAFSLRIQIRFSDNLIVATATATGVRLVALPVPKPPRLIVSPDIAGSHQVLQLQKAIDAANEFQKRVLEDEEARGAEDPLRVDGDGEIHSASRRLQRRRASKRRRRRQARNAPQQLTDGFDATHAHSDTDSDSSESSCSSSTASNVSEEGRDDIKEFVIDIDDVEEAESHLGLFDDAPQADVLCYSLPYLPSDPNLFSTSQRFVVERRYELSEDSTVEHINACVGDVRKALLFKLGRFARGAPGRQCVVLGYANDIMFTPVTQDLHIRLSGTFATLQDDAIHTLEDRAFLEVDALAGSALASHGTQGHGGGSSMVRIPTSTTVGSSEVRSGLPSKSPERPQSTTMELMASDSAVDYPSPNSGGTNYLSSGTEPSRVALVDALTFSALRTLHIAANSPFTLPFVIQREEDEDEGPQGGGAEADGAGAESHGRQADTAGGDGSGGGEAEGGRAHVAIMDGSVDAAPGTDAQAVIERNLSKLTSFASVSLKKIKATATSVVSRTKESSGAKGAQHTDPQSSRPMRLRQQLPQVATRSVRVVDFVKSGVLLTPLPFVPGKAIAKYIGRLSKHFIREERNIDDANQLSAFFRTTEMEFHSVVTAFVIAMGGDTLIDHRVTVHEVWDSDGSDTAFMFVTVTGHVVRTTEKAVLEPSYKDVAT